MIKEFEDICKRTNFADISKSGLALCFSCGIKCDKSQISHHQLECIKRHSLAAVMRATTASRIKKNSFIPKPNNYPTYSKSRNYPKDSDMNSNQNYIAQRKEHGLLEEKPIVKSVSLKNDLQKRSSKLIPITDLPVQPEQDHSAMNYVSAPQILSNDIMLGDDNDKRYEIPEDKQKPPKTFSIRRASGVKIKTKEKSDVVKPDMSKYEEESFDEPTLDTSHYSTHEEFEKYEQKEENSPISTIPTEYEAPESNDRIPCNICNRKFNPDALERHRGPCEKLNQRKRQVYDSSRMRISGIAKDNQVMDKSTLKPVKPSTKSKQKAKVRQGRPSSPPIHSVDGEHKEWATSHKNLIKAVRSTKTKSYPTAKFAKAFQQQQEQDLHQCSSCLRKFNELALERHEPICQKKKDIEKFRTRRLNSNATIQEKSMGLSLRTQYKPPLPSAVRRNS